MLKVHYEHPPRQWDFYAGYLMWLSIILLPVILLFATWSNLLSIELNIAVASFIILLYLYLKWRQVLEQYVLEYDALLDKSKDVTEQEIAPPKVLEEGINAIKDLGFTRLGEESTFIMLNQEPLMTWFLLNDSQEVHVEVVEFTSEVPYLAAFYTWFKGHQNIMTFYPKGDSVKYDDFRVEGISTSLEAAYNFHMRQVAEFEDLHGAPVKFTSLEAINEYGDIYRKKHRPRLHRNVQVRNFAIWIATNLLYGTGIYMASAAIFSAFFGFGLASIPMMGKNNVFSAVYAIAAAIILLVSRMPSRSIQQAKKKAA